MPSKKEKRASKQNADVSEKLTLPNEITKQATELKKKDKPKKSVKKPKKKQPAEFQNVPGRLPISYPNDSIVAVKNMPENCKQSDVISAFSRFGSLVYVQRTSRTNALIGFLESKGARAAIEAGRIFVKGQKVNVKARNDKAQRSAEDIKDQLWYRTVLVYRFDPNTKEEDVRKHFKLCGGIESIRFFKKKINSHFEIIFENDSSAEKALQLHNSVLKECTIHVRRKSDEPCPWDLKRTIVLLNPSGLTSIEGSKILKLFNGCGEIEKCDVFCYKNRLALLAFEHEEGMQKALSLNGKTKDGIKIEVELYSSKVGKRALPIHNNNQALADLLKKSTKSKVCIERIADGLTEPDISNLFKTCGPVKNVELSEDRSAVVEFENSEGYCSAFSLHECVFGGKKLILKPYSVQEMPNLEENISQKKGKGVKRNLINDNALKPTKQRKKA